MAISIEAIDKVLMQVNNVRDVAAALKNITEIGRSELRSKIWDAFNFSNFEKDIISAQKWIQQNLNRFPEGKGIYLGLDTLNMDNGAGTNVEIGLSSTCDPSIFSNDWTYDCDYFGEGHLINGLFLNSDNFENDEKWTSDERSDAEYLIFLGYSGVILREALLKVETKNDFLSIWGFHDGDMFFLVNKRGSIRGLIANIDI